MGGVQDDNEVVRYDNGGVQDDNEFVRDDTLTIFHSNHSNMGFVLR